jgi:transcriptional accessory protein Tex/SPT6
MPNKPFKPKDFGRNKEKLELFARNYGKKAALDQLIDEYNAKMHKKALNEAKTGGKDPEIVHISTNIKTIGRISSEVTKRYITPEPATESTDQAHSGRFYDYVDQIANRMGGREAPDSTPDPNQAFRAKKRKKATLSHISNELDYLDREEDIPF